MEWKDVASVVSKAAPVLGTAIGGPVGTAIGGAVSLVLKAFGLSDDATPEQVSQAIKQDPEATLKLMVVENEFKLKQRDQDIQELRAVLGDKADARKLESDVTKSTGKQDKSGVAFDWLIILGFFATLICYMFSDVPQDQAGNLGLLIGALISAFVTVIQYRRGSSMSSAWKTELLSKAEPIKK
ncbi:MAG: hypothetical protein WC374_04285 [Phycisphaerae bacterium]|jgi:hypothetical protein